MDDLTGFLTGQSEEWEVLNHARDRGAWRDDQMLKGPTCVRPVSFVSAHARNVNTHPRLSVLLRNVAISIVGKGAWLENMFVERLRSSCS